MGINVEQILNNILKQTEQGKVEIGSDDLGKWTYYVKLENDHSNNINLGDVALKIKNKS